MGPGGGPEEEDEHGFKQTLRGVLVLSRSDTLWFIPFAEIHLSGWWEEQKKESDSRMEEI